MNRVRRAPLVVLLIVALLATGVTRQLAASKRDAGRRILGSAAEGSSAQLSRMNSFALALLLGGLRGPLVMMLWSSSESQKTEKNLEDFDTKVEWIRLLQPEFDSVHIFQIWNKAYNISVQMASLANKYLTIIDAIDYGMRVDRERPDNINILYAIGSVFGDKLGDSAEKQYYARRVRAETLPHAAKQKLKADDPGYRPLELEAMLDEKGYVLPQYLRPTSTLLVDPEDPTVRYDGSDLQFLKKFEPYTYGLNPFALGYNYRKRSQLLQRLASQSHAQLSDVVIDSRPGMDLKKWAESEQELSRRLEIQAFGRVVPTEVTELGLSAADVKPDVKIDPEKRKLAEQAVFGYGMALRVAEEADAEYVGHIKRFKTNANLYESHRDDLAAQRAMLEADRDYLAAMLAPEGEQRQKLFLGARDAYRRAVTRYAATALKYYVPGEIAEHVFPPGVTKANFANTLGADLDKIGPDAMRGMLAASIQAMRQSGYPPGEDVDDYIRAIQRAELRLGNLPK